MSETPPIDLRPWEPEEGGIGFLLHPAVAGEPPRLALWLNPGGESYFHVQVSAAMGISSKHIVAYVRIHPDYGTSVYPSGELDGHTYEEWVVTLDPRLSIDVLDFDAEDLYDDDEPEEIVEGEPASVPGPRPNGVARRPLDAYLSDALGATLTLTDGTGPPAALAEHLSAAAGYMLQRDANLRRLGRTAAFNALARFAAGPKRGSRLHDKWAVIVADHLRPAVAELLVEIREHAGLAPDVLAALDARMAKADYRGGLWEPCEALGRLLVVRRELAAASLSSEPLVEVGRRALAAVERLIGQLGLEIVAGWDGETLTDPRIPRGWGRAAATRHEAIADALLNPAAGALTANLYADGSLAGHFNAVREQVGEPVAVPVIVLSNDRWFREIHPERLDARGVHLRYEAILLSRATGEQAARERRQGRLSHTLVHELVHATQRDRRGPWLRPPYDARSFAVEGRVVEGLTEYFTQRVMLEARAKWAGAGENPYSQREFRDSAYYGYSFVCMAAVSTAGGVPETFLRELSHNPHKLTMFVELLTGRYTAERKAAIVPVFEQLFALAEAWAGQPRKLEVDLSAAAGEAFREYQERHGPTRTSPVAA